MDSPFEYVPLPINVLWGLLFRAGNPGAADLDGGDINPSEAVCTSCSASASGSAYRQKRKIIRQAKLLHAKHLLYQNSSTLKRSTSDMKGHER